MAASNLNALLRVPGRLALNPTDMSQAFPFGGTDLGLVRDVVARPGTVVKKLRDETLGVIPTVGLELGEAWSLSVAVRALEQGHAGVFFRTTGTGAVTGEETFSHNPVSNPPGTVSPKVAVLFCPFDELNQDFLYFPAAISYPDVAAALARSIQREGLMLGVFDATPRAADGLAAVNARKEDLVL